MIITKSIKNTLKNVNNKNHTKKKLHKDQFVFKIEFQKVGHSLSFWKILRYISLHKGNNTSSNQVNTDYYKTKTIKQELLVGSQNN